MSSLSAHPAAADAAFELADRLHSASIHLLRRARREDDASGIPAPQLSALSVVVFGGPITLSALAAAEQVRPPTMTRIVSALEKARLAERRPSADDGRVIHVVATKEGAKLLAEGRRRRVAALAREIHSLSRSDRAQLERAVAILEGLVGARHWPARPRPRS